MASVQGSEKMTGDETYRGWKNFQTWVIDRWLRYDSDSLTRLYEGAKAAGDRHTFAKSLKEALGAEAKDMLEAGDLFPTARGIFGDLLCHSLDRIDFEEIADHVFDEIEGEETEESGGEDTEPATLADLREAYNLAIERGEDSFVIGGMEFQTFFARYILNFSERFNVLDTASLRDMIQKDKW
jgi:hypothetical protein